MPTGQLYHWMPAAPSAGQGKFIYIASFEPKEKQLFEGEGMEILI